MTTNIENIKTLLARFYEGQTTTDEERTLADFFRHDNIPDDLLPDRQLFLSLCEIADVLMPEDIAAEIDTFVKNLADEPVQQQQTPHRHRFVLIDKFRTPPKMFYRAAATVALLLALGGGIGGGLLNYQRHTAPYRDTCANAEEAAAEIARANQMIAKATEQCMQTLGSSTRQAETAINNINQYITF